MLADFFALNPYSSIDTAKTEGELEIVKPWGDTSLVLRVNDNFSHLFEALNKVKMPESFSAIWHKETQSLEVIWTAFKLPKSQSEIKDRKFTFTHKGRSHDCAFGISSPELLAIAQSARPITLSDTNHRNIQSFSIYARNPDEVGKSFDRPRSFWINNVDWDAMDVVDMVSHLNFYLRYYDTMCPTVLMHSEPKEAVATKRTRYIKDEFPSVIESNLLDENLLSFWSFAGSGDSMLRFLLYYRIMEYAAYHFVTDDIKEQIRKLLVSPDLKSDINRAIGTLMGAMGSSKLSDSQRLSAMVRKVVSPELIWRDLEANSAFFSKDTVFEGGFIVRAPIGRGDKAEGFNVTGVERVCDRFRQIRNALSHGKDQETAGVIRPTPENAKLFVPWVHLIGIAAGEVVLYGTST